MRTEIDVLVIGSSQAGLAIGYYLKKNNKSFAIVGKETRIGDIWRNRYDSLILFTPRRYSSLPGMSSRGDPNGFATKDEIADYLEAYAHEYELPVQLETEVLSLKKESEDFIVHTNRGKYASKQVVIATGPFQKPFIPPFANRLSSDVFQVHSSRYVNPSQLQNGPVLVVGAGNSGAQIAVELARDRDVIISVGHRLKFFPLQAMGKSIFWWFDTLGILHADVNSRAGRYLSKQSDPIFGKELKYAIHNGKMTLKPTTQDVIGNTFTFADGSQAEVKNVIWATGFHPDYSWIQIEGVLNSLGKPIHQRGITHVEGLYFLGLPWQYRRGSALIGGVGADADYLINNIVRS
jgi:putative flavoprotein involved in K+ transport